MPLALYNGAHTHYFEYSEHIHIYMCSLYIYIYNEIQHTNQHWFKHILFITRHDKRIGQRKKLRLALSKHSYMVAISAQIQCFYFKHTHTLTLVDVVSKPLIPPS